MLYWRRKNNVDEGVIECDLNPFTKLGFKNNAIAKKNIHIIDINKNKHESYMLSKDSEFLVLESYGHEKLARIMFESDAGKYVIGYIEIDENICFINNKLELDKDKELYEDIDNNIIKTIQKGEKVIPLYTFKDMIYVIHGLHGGYIYK